MKTRTTLFFLTLFLVVGLNEAQAQTSIEIGPRLGFDLGGDVEYFFIGADARFGVESLPVLLNTAFDYYFVGENVSFFQLSLNALYPFSIESEVFSLYAGGGLGISRISVDVGDGIFGGFDASSTDVGLNLIGGATFGVGALKAFAQAQLTFGDIDLFTVGGGLLFRIGGE